MLEEIIDSGVASPVLAILAAERPVEVHRLAIELLRHLTRRSSREEPLVALDPTTPVLRNLQRYPSDSTILRQAGGALANLGERVATQIAAHELSGNLQYAFRGAGEDEDIVDSFCMIFSRTCDKARSADACDRLERLVLPAALEAATRFTRSELRIAADTCRAVRRVCDWDGGSHVMAALRAGAVDFFLRLVNDNDGGRAIPAATELANAFTVLLARVPPESFVAFFDETRFRVALGLVNVGLRIPELNPRLQPHITAMMDAVEDSPEMRDVLAAMRSPNLLILHARRNLRNPGMLSWASGLLFEWGFHGALRLAIGEANGFPFLIETLRASMDDEKTVEAVMGALWVLGFAEPNRAKFAEVDSAMGIVERAGSRWSRRDNVGQYLQAIRALYARRRG